MPPSRKPAGTARAAAPRQAAAPKNAAAKKKTAAPEPAPALATAAARRRKAVAVLARCAPSFPIRAAASTTGWVPKGPGNSWWPPSSRPSAPTRGSTWSRPGCSGSSRRRATSPRRRWRRSRRRSAPPASTATRRSRCRARPRAAGAATAGVVPNDMDELRRGAGVRAQDGQRGARGSLRDPGRGGGRHARGADRAQARADRPGRPGEGRAAPERVRAREADWRDFGHLLIEHGRRTCGRGRRSATTARSTAGARSRA